MNKFQSNILRDSHIFHDTNAILFDIFFGIKKICRCLRVIINTEEKARIEFGQLKMWYNVRYISQKSSGYRFKNTPGLNMFVPHFIENGKNINYANNTPDQRRRVALFPAHARTFV